MRRVPQPWLLSRAQSQPVAGIHCQWIPVSGGEKGSSVKVDSQIVSSQANVSDTPFDQKSPGHPEVGVLNCYKHKNIQTYRPTDGHGDSMIESAQGPIHKNMDQKFQKLVHELFASALAGYSKCGAYSLVYFNGKFFKLSKQKCDDLNNKINLF